MRKRERAKREKNRNTLSGSLPASCLIRLDFFPGDVFLSPLFFSASISIPKKRDTAKPAFAKAKRDLKEPACLPAWEFAKIRKKGRDSRANSNGEKNV